MTDEQTNADLNAADRDAAQENRWLAVILLVVAVAACLLGGL